MLEAAVSLGAEAQSALREAVSAIGFPGDEPSQSAMFRWLRQTANERDLFIPRYMRMTDKPWPPEIASLSGRITDLQTRHRIQIATKKSCASALAKIRYHLNQIAPNRENSYDWNKIFATVSEIVPKHLRGNDVQFRELLVKYIDDIPEETVVMQAGQDVLEAIDLFLASRPEAEPGEKTRLCCRPK